MHTLDILSLNVTGLNSAVKRTRVLEHLHRKSISCALICNTASSGTFRHMFWECPVVIDPGADWPSGEPGEFPVAWQPIWLATLLFFSFFFCCFCLPNVY